MIEERDRKHKHSVYQHHLNAIRITGETAFMEKVNYIHLNPVKAGGVAAGSSGAYPVKQSFTGYRASETRCSEQTNRLVSVRREGKQAPARPRRFWRQGRAYEHRAVFVTTGAIEL